MITLQMQKTTPINFRIASNEKDRFFQNARKLGLSPSSLLTLFIVNFNKCQKITLSLNDPIELEPFVPDKTENIVKDFEKTGKYSKKFLTELEKGLKKSKLNK